jgi:hypothetical protein
MNRPLLGVVGKMPEVNIKPPELGAKKLLERVRQSKSFYLWGVQNPKVSPTEAAIAVADSWHRIMSDPRTKQKWVENRKAAGDETWLAGILGKGADRLIPGVEFGIGKYLEFAKEFYPYMAAKIAEIKKMPKVTIEDRINRAAAMIRHNYNFKRSKRAYNLKDLEDLRKQVEAFQLPGG